VHILARTRHVRNAQHLLDLGADEVISEEFESALEIFTRALKRYQIPEEEVVRIIERSKRLGNALFTRCTDPNQHRKVQNFETIFKATHVHTVRVEPGSSVEGKAIADLDLKDRFGIREFGFRRGTMRFTQPDPSQRLEAGDTLVFFISDEKAGKIIPLFSSGK
jgi:CPA2 family monovalent cation:H+ antiporter-2